MQIPLELRSESWGYQGRGLCVEGTEREQTSNSQSLPLESDWNILERQGGGDGDWGSLLQEPLAGECLPLQGCRRISWYWKRSQPLLASTAS